MPAYDDNPSRHAILVRTRARISTVRGALAALASPVAQDKDERARQASKNLEMMVDVKEMRQVKTLTEHAHELNTKFAQLAVTCTRVQIPQTVDPERRRRLADAVAAFVGSPVASGRFI
jgi:hypothetical protein